MSGIVGIVNLDGRPVDPELLERMTASLDFRGPDAHEVWTCGAVGFGHTLLRTTYEAAHERQPLSFDGQTWIVADCRVDAREELVGKLCAKGRARAALDRPDVELILHAWHVWGEACVEHLLGDFAFAIWDAPNRRLFCARDHMGVKPFYYAQQGATVVFSNTLDCVRMHPAVSDKLNDLAIADFLLFGLNHDKATTCSADIHRLPPGAFVHLGGSTPKPKEYWRLPVDAPQHLVSLRSYEEEYLSILEESLTDRARYGDIGVFMSGGIDSTGLCAALLGQTEERSMRPRVTAYTTSFKGFDDEEYFARLACLKIGANFEVRDPLGDSDLCDKPQSPADTSEPCVNPFCLPEDRDYYGHISSSTRVCLYGEGPDNGLIYEPAAAISHFLKKRDLTQAAMLLLFETTNPSRYLEIFNRSRGAKAPRSAPQISAFPSYLAPELVDQFDLRGRWERERAPLQSPHPSRPRAHASFELPEWQAMFEDLDPAFTRAPLEVRHPYLDIRMLKFMLRLPQAPWCRDKFVARRAFRKLLPPAVLKRPKSPMLGDPWRVKTERRGIPDLPPHSDLANYVQISSTTITADKKPPSFGNILRIRSLNHWLHVRNAYNREACCGASV